MPIEAPIEGNGVGNGAKKIQTEDRQAGSPSQSRQPTLPPSANPDESLLPNSMEETSRANGSVTNIAAPQRNASGQSDVMDDPSNRHISPGYRKKKKKRTETSDIPPPSQGTYTSSNINASPASFPIYATQSPFQMFSSPGHTSHQTSATPILQPYRSNSLPPPQNAYPLPMYSSHMSPTNLPQSAPPQSYHPLPTSTAQSPYPMPQTPMQSIPANTHGQLYPYTVPMNMNPMNASQPATDTNTDAFVASDPFHPHSLEKGQKEISSFDDIEIPVLPTSHGWNSIPHASAAAYMNQLGAYGRPDGQPMEKPGSINSPFNTQKPVTPSPFPSYWDQSPLYTGYPTLNNGGQSWNTTPAAPTVGNAPSSRISSWGTDPDYTTSGTYASPWVPPPKDLPQQVIPTPPWASDYQYLSSPLRPAWSDYYDYAAETRKISMPVPHIPQIIPSRPRSVSPELKHQGQIHRPSELTDGDATEEYTSQHVGYKRVFRRDSSDYDHAGESRKISMPVPHIPLIIPPRPLPPLPELKHQDQVHQPSENTNDNAAEESTGDHSADTHKISMPVPHIPQIISSDLRSASPESENQDFIYEPFEYTNDSTTKDSASQHVTDTPAPTSAGPAGETSAGTALEPILEHVAADKNSSKSYSIEPEVAIPLSSSPESNLSSIPEDIVPSLSARPVLTHEEHAGRTDNNSSSGSPLPMPIIPIISPSSSPPSAIPSVISDWSWVEPSWVTAPVPRVPLIIPVRPASAETSSSDSSKSTHIFLPHPSAIPYINQTSLYVDSPWNMPSVNYPVASPPISKKPSFWSKARDFFSWPFSFNTPSSVRLQQQQQYQYPPIFVPPPVYVPFTVPPYTKDSTVDMTKVLVDFVTGTLPSQIYLHFLLRLPSLYFTRVARIFEEADLSLPEIKKMALETATTVKGPLDLQIFESSNVPVQYTRLKSTWEGFIDSVMREWKTFNIISVLLLSAILTILQIESAADDPITRYTAISSLICALISLLFGCMYIIRFGSMRKTYKAAEWALEAKKTKTVIWWNVWVLLAMPAIWLTWSIILYIACTMSFVWRTSSQSDTQPINTSKTALLTVRIAISSVLGLGMIYGVLILSTFSRYGSVMDKTWKKRIDGWVREKVALQGNHGQYMSTPHYGSSYYHTPYAPASTNTPAQAPASYTGFGNLGPVYTPYVPGGNSAYGSGYTPYFPGGNSTFGPGYKPYVPGDNLVYGSGYDPYFFPGDGSTYGSGYTPYLPRGNSVFVPPVYSRPSAPMTPFIPPLPTPRAESMDFQYGTPIIPPARHGRSNDSRQNSAEYSNASDVTRSDTRHDSLRHNSTHIPPSRRTSTTLSPTSPDVDNMTLSNTRRNSGHALNDTSMSARVLAKHPAPSSNPSSAHFNKRPTVFEPPSPASTMLSPIFGAPTGNIEGNSHSISTALPAPQRVGKRSEASKTLRFLSPVQSAASDKEEFGQLSPVNPTPNTAPPLDPSEILPGPES